LCIG